ncbi:hypothetical protein Sjap_022218 [Stephania japonica]|uniref:Uncharacterized protein n=1 Tax=Stephania japonica TaxID=461633 RepID=A0AAP0HU87_9MAGN
MARGKSIVSREDVDGEPTRVQRAGVVAAAPSAPPAAPSATPSVPAVHGKRKAHTVSYRKAKVQTSEGVRGRRLVRDNVEDEASHVPVGSSSQGGADGDEARRSAMEETTTSQPQATRSSSGVVGENFVEPEDDPFAPFPGGPIDRSLFKSFKDHVAAAIWNKEIYSLFLANIDRYLSA